MKKRGFLVPVAALAAALTTEQAVANVGPEASTPPTGSVELTGAKQAERVVTSNGHDQFSFIIKRTDSGEVMAWHESHASHTSHGSHRSHYSGY